MTEVIDEPVEVIVAYRQVGKPAVPTVMGWQNRIYRFSQFGFCHPTYEGRKLVHVFTMSDSALTYRLEFNTESLRWRLKEISDGLPA